MTAVAVAAAAWAVGRLLLAGNHSMLRGASALAISLAAAPALAVFGAPWRSTPVVVPALVVSAVIWSVVGLAAARRATSRPAASWRDFWREWAWIAGAVWAGTLVGVAVAGLVLLLPG